MSSFAYETCLLKHHVRVNGWLPACRRQLATIRKQSAKKSRRLRYFTFCASGAVDVLMLNMAQLLKLSDQEKFDTVVFFDKDEEAVNDTYTNIPGSKGFPADFTKLVLAHDPQGDALPLEALSYDTATSDTQAKRTEQRLLLQRREFISCFPFDVINLDLEAFLLKANEEFPGKILQCLMQILEWQKNPLEGGKTIDEFTLMYTTQIGPRELTDQYLGLLEETLSENIRGCPDLRTVLEKRTGHGLPSSLREANFEEFYRISLPKVLAAYLRREDWLIDPDPGIKIFEFDRPSARGGYKMLHLVMHVKRQHPPKVKRIPPRVEGDGVQEAYTAVAHKLFQERETIVSPETIDEDSLSANLELIFARREMFALGRLT